MENGAIFARIVEIIVGYIIFVVIEKPLFRMFPFLEPLKCTFLRIVAIIIVIIFVALLIYSCFI